MKASVTQKYLEHYAEVEARLVTSNGDTWQHVVCIPACQEEESLLDTLQSLRRARGAEEALVVVVINAAEDADTVVHDGNAKTSQLLAETCGLKGQGLSWGTLDGMGLLVVDRWSDGQRLPSRQGVGLARKIACDVALSLMASGHIQSSWIRCTDADVDVPVTYFEQLTHRVEGTSAATYSFVHLPEGDSLQQKAMRLYDVYLQSYVTGLARAGSPYAFHTIGSLIAIDSASYAIVRGFPKREAGEDFYLLNKLAKVGRVLSLEGAPVRIRGRVSDRVPFGTGAAVQSIRAELAEGRAYRIYDPRVFDAVGLWLSALRDFVDAPDIDALRAQTRGAPAPLGEALYATLEGQGAFAAAQKASEQVSGDVLWRRLMEWNDAFRTLKLVHGVRDAGIGTVQCPDSIPNAESTCPVN